MINVWTVAAFVRVETGTARTTPWRRHRRAFLRRTDAATEYARLLALARAGEVPGSPLQYVVLRRHKLDPDKPVGKLLVEVFDEPMDGHVDLDRPAWAEGPAIVEARYDDPKRDLPR